MKQQPLAYKKTRDWSSQGEGKRDVDRQGESHAFPPAHHPVNHHLCCMREARLIHVHFMEIFLVEECPYVLYGLHHGFPFFWRFLVRSSQLRLAARRFSINVLYRIFVLCGLPWTDLFPVPGQFDNWNSIRRKLSSADPARCFPRLVSRVSRAHLFLIHRAYF
mgnify:CR=1 FL=1